LMKRFVEGEDRRLWGLRAWAAGRPAYHPATMLKIYVYGYVNQIASSRRLEREAERNVEMMWLTERFPPHSLRRKRRPTSGTIIVPARASTFTSATCPQASHLAITACTPF
jgi:hypothetical protein